MEVWQSILLAIGGNTALLVVLAWLARSFVQNSLDRDLERHKSALLLEAQSVSERLRHELQMVAQEHQLTFSRLQERRASVIAETYGLLVEAYWEGSAFASPISLGEVNKQEQYGSALKAMTSFYQYYEKNRIYLPAPICDEIDSLIKDMRGHVFRMGGYIKFSDDQLPPAALEKVWAARDTTWKYFEEQAPAAKSLLERELRLLIGDKPLASGAS